LAKLKTVTLSGVVMPTAAVPVAIQEISIIATGAPAGADTLDTVSNAKRTASGAPSLLLSCVRLQIPVGKAARLTRQWTGAVTVLSYLTSAVTAPRSTTLLTLTGNVTLTPPNGRRLLSTLTSAGVVCWNWSGRCPTNPGAGALCTICKNDVMPKAVDMIRPTRQRNQRILEDCGEYFIIDNQNQ
jgi:hypothetical protein